MSRNSTPTERELEVIALVAEGLTNEQIGGRLDIALDTVRSHLVNVGGKANTRSRAAIVNWAWRNGYVGDRRDLQAEIAQLNRSLGRLHATCTTAEEAQALRNQVENLQAMYRTACGFEGWVP